MSNERIWGQRLLKMGFAVQRYLHQVLAASPGEDLATVVCHEGGDSVFELDRRVEPIIEREIEQWTNDCKPLILIAEGIDDGGRRVYGPSDELPRFRVIVDPIDGTRNLMYDKRSAWFIAAVAENRGEETVLADTFAAVLVELPTSKQLWCDAFVATSDSQTAFHRTLVGGDDRRPRQLRPSSADTLEFGFAQVSSFFPGTKVLAAELMERIAEETIGPVQPNQALLFEDQYISTGGQMAELIVGHDRFCCDLRPIFHDILTRRSNQNIRGLECHPYDVSALLVAQKAGVVITDGFGAPLNCPLDVQTGIHWCGFANPILAAQIQPVINAWLEEHDVVAPPHK